MLKNVYEKWNEIDEIFQKNKEDFIMNFYMSRETISQVYLAIENEKKAIYVEFSKDSLFDVECPSLKGMKIEICKNESIDANKKFIKITNESNSEEVFLAFSSSLCDSLMNCSNYFDTYKIILNVIKEYKDYFSNSNHQLSLSEEQGLCAELIELSKHIEKFGDKCVYNWQGPSKNKRDFIYNKFSMEVKSTTKQIDSAITISNENQLDNNYPDKLVNLYLSVYVMEQSDIGLNVNDCISEIMEKLQDVNAKLAFTSNLLKLKVNIYDYKSQFKFTVEEHHLYDINDYFPKITRNNIPSEIYAVKYKLRIVNLANYEIKEDDIYE